MADGGGEVYPPKKLDKEEKLRLVREKQAEERLKRLEELKKHALEAQQLREQKEQERRRRMEELRVKENERRSQVEERKKLIWEAEQERREAIVRKNQEREARIDAKRRNERSSIVFAFGSSTPRLMDTYDSGAFMMPRRASSSVNLRLFPNNMTMSMSAAEPPTPRRPSEREMEPKKRASSAGGLYRNAGDQMSTSMYEVFHWETGPTKPRLSIPLNCDSSLSNIDRPHRSVPQTPLHPKPLPFSSAVPSGRAGEPEDSTLMTSSTLRVGRRKTDLMPTMPSPREGSGSRPGSGTRSLARTPGRAFSMARLDVLAQPRAPHTQPLSAPSKSMSRSTNHLAESRRFQSNSLGRGDTSKSMVQLQPRITRAERLRQKARAATKSASPDSLLSPGDVTPSRPGSVLSQFSLSSASTARLRSTPRRTRPFSIHVTGVSKDKEKISSPSEEKPKGKEIQEINHKEAKEKIKEVKDNKLKENKMIKDVKEIKAKDVKESNVNKAREVKESKVNKPPAPKPTVTKKQAQQKNEEIKRTQPKVVEISKNIVENNNEEIPRGEELKTELEVEPPKEEVKTSEVLEDVPEPKSETKEENKVVEVVQEVAVSEELLVNVEQEEKEVEASKDVEEATLVDFATTQDVEGELGDPDQGKNNLMSRSKITTEEEAKAALAERRRLAREQAEREAEAERLRLEREAQMEAERIRKEEEEQRLAEEEQLRLLEEARRQEEERLMQAIQEAQKREEEEKQRRQQEEQARIEKEEAEKKAREEVERQRIEMAERLKREEEERTARRKRVEAIMKRTRNNPVNASNREKGEEDGAEREKDESKGNLEAFLHGERVCTDKTLINGQQSKENHRTGLDNMIGSNQSNGVVGLTTGRLAEEEDCLNSNSDPTIETPLISFQGKTKETPMAANYMA